MHSTLAKDMKGTMEPMSSIMIKDKANRKKTSVEQNLLTLPLPMLTFLLAGVACALVWRLDLGNQLSRYLFTSLFLVISLGGLLVGLRFGYGIQNFVPIQRMLPLFVGPLIYLSFVSLTIERQYAYRKILIHISLAFVLALAPLLAINFLGGYDLVIALSYLTYGVAVLLLWTKGPDHLTHTRLELTETLRNWMLIGASIQLILLLLDSAIAISFAWQREDSAIALVSIGAIISITFLIVVIIAISNGLKARATTIKTQMNTDPDCNKLQDEADRLLQKTKLYLDTDLTVDRLAKRLHVPARALSEAVNKTKGINVSQYVNGYRLTHAIELLEQSNLSVAKVMEQSGFLTRSNFYREFQRVYGCSPAQYRQDKK